MPLICRGGLVPPASKTKRKIKTLLQNIPILFFPRSTDYCVILSGTEWSRTFATQEQKREMLASKRDLFCLTFPNSSKTICMIVTL